MEDTKRSLEEVLAAIDGSDGIKAVIARRLGVSRPTVDAYLKRWKSAEKAYEQANEAFLDLCQSLIARNVRLGLAEQEEEKRPVDSGDARWTLGMKGGDRGYVPKQAVEQSGDLNIKLKWGDSAESND